jgi:hypothetical protein
MEHIIGQHQNYLLNSILEAVAEGHRVFYIDPYGTGTDTLLPHIPTKYKHRTIVFDPTLPEHVMSWNPLADVDDIPLTASRFVDTIKDVWGYGDIATPVLELYLYYSLVALMETRQPLIGMKYLLTSDDYRNELIKDIKDSVVQDFWSDYGTLPKRDRYLETASTRNKIGTLIGDPRIRNIIGTSSSQLSFNDAHIVLVRLPKQKLSAGKTALIGSLLLSQASNEPFHFFIEDCHLFARGVIIELLGTAPKVVASHQYLDQLHPSLKDALFGLARQKVIFRVSNQDAKELVNRLGPDNVNTPLDELRDGFARFYPPHRDYPGDTLGSPVLFRGEDADAQAAIDIMHNTVRNFTRPRESVEAEIAKFLERT